MSVKKTKKNPAGIARRQFIKEAGLLVGGAAVGGTALLAACGPTDKTTRAELITVLNPEGQPPPVILAPMAARLGSLDGKKIYLVDIHFTGTQIFLEEMAKTLQEKYPKANIIYRLKAGAYAENDAALWDEIKQNGDAVLMGVGH